MPVTEQNKSNGILINKLYRRYADSPGVMTALSVIARSGGMVVPLILLAYFEYSPIVIAFWLLVITFQSVVGGINGALPTISMQMLSYAQAGSRNLFGTMEEHQQRSESEVNRPLSAQINAALVTVYGYIQMIWLVLAATFGTAVIWVSLIAMPDIVDAVLMWIVFILLSAVRLRLQPYVAYLFAVGETAFARRVEAMVWIMGSLFTAAAFIIWGNVAFAMFCLYSPVLAQFLIVRRAAIAKGWEDDCAESSEHSRASIMSAIWSRAWRGTLGIMAGMMTLYGGGFIFAQYADPIELAGFLLAINVLGILQQIAISPLYGALPEMARRYASGKKTELLDLANHVMKRSSWAFALIVGTVLPGLFVLREFAGQELAFVTPQIWLALCIATFVIRYGAGHIHFYTVTNHVIVHWINGLFAILYLLPLLILGNPPLLYYPLVQGSAALVYATIARHMSRRHMGYPLRMDMPFTILSFVAMLVFLTLSQAMIGAGWPV